MTDQVNEKLSSSRRQYVRWTDEQVEFLRRNAALGATTIAVALGKQVPGVYQKAKQLGIDVTKSAKTPDSDI